MTCLTLSLIHKYRIYFYTTRWRDDGDINSLFLNIEIWQSKKISGDKRDLIQVAVFLSTQMCSQAQREAGASSRRQGPSEARVPPGLSK